MSPEPPLVRCGRAVLGPRVGVRDYTLLGHSPGLDLSSGERGVLMGFLFAARKLAEPRTFFAFFPMGAANGDRWALVRCEGERGSDGLAVVGEAAVLDHRTLEAIDWAVHRLLAAWPKSDPRADLNRSLEFDVRSAHSTPVVRGVSDAQMRAWLKAASKASTADSVPILVEVADATGLEDVLVRIWESLGARRAGLSFTTFAELEWSPGGDEGAGFGVTIVHKGRAPILGPRGRRLCHFSQATGLVIDAALRRDWDAKLWAFESTSGLALQDVSDWEGDRAAKTFEQALRFSFRSGYGARPAVEVLRKLVPFAIGCRQRGEWTDDDLDAFSRALVLEFEKELGRTPAEAAVELDVYLGDIEPLLKDRVPRALPTRLAIDSGALLHLPRERFEAVRARMFDRDQDVQNVSMLFMRGIAGRVDNRASLAAWVQSRLRSPDARDLPSLALAMLSWFVQDHEGSPEGWPYELSAALLETGRLREVRQLADLIDQQSVETASGSVVISALRNAGGALGRFDDVEVFATALAIENAALSALVQREVANGASQRL